MLCDKCKAESCQIDGCSNWAEYELWWNVGGGGLITRLRVCEDHKQAEIDRRKERGAA